MCGVGDDDPSMRRFQHFDLVGRIAEGQRVTRAKIRDDLSNGVRLCPAQRKLPKPPAPPRVNALSL